MKLPKKHACSVGQIKHVTQRKKYHAYTCPEGKNFLVHERVKKSWSVPNYPYTPVKSQMVHSSDSLISLLVHLMNYVIFAMWKMFIFIYLFVYPFMWFFPLLYILHTIFLQKPFAVFWANFCENNLTHWFGIYQKNCFPSVSLQERDVY